MVILVTTQCFDTNVIDRISDVIHRVVDCTDVDSYVHGSAIGSSNSDVLDDVISVTDSFEELYNGVYEMLLTPR